MAMMEPAFPYPRAWPGWSARGEVLVGAGGVLAGPLVELLAGAAAGAVHVQAQSAARSLEPPGPMRMLDRQPLAARGAVRDLLDDVPGASGVGAAGYRAAGFLRPQLAIAAAGGNELDLLVGLAIAGPLIDRRAGRAGVPVHIQTQA